MRAFTAVTVLLALLACSAGAAADDPVTHWRTVAGKALVHHVDKAKDTASGLDVPDLGTEGLAAQAEAAAEAVTSLDPQQVLDSLGDPLGPIEAQVEGLLGGLPPLPAVDETAAFAVRVVQYQASNAVRLIEHFRP